MRKPLLSPAPVDILAGVMVTEVPVDIMVVLQPAGDPVTNAARGIGIFIIIEEPVFNVIPAGAGNDL